MLLHVVVPLLAVAAASARLAPFAPGNVNLTGASRTASAFGALQMTRERYVERAEKNTLARLFARVDCPIPEPSTLACPCVHWDTCGSGDTCYDLDNDDEHCGTCATPPCTGTEPACCGACLPTGGICADLQADDAHCGICTRVCGAGESCCNGACIPTTNDPLNCGGCGIDCGGLECCNGVCTDTWSDPLNCGECGFECPDGQFCNCYHCSSERMKLGKRC